VDLLPFQTVAAKLLVERIVAYLQDPNSPTETRFRLVPFFQNLSALTGAGKTVVVAETIELLREHLPLEPIVLWVSKGKVVVEQTLTNLETGKYKDLIPGYLVKALLECAKADIEADQGLLLFATVATFNQVDQARRVFKLALDKADKSLWDLLKTRETPAQVRKPLVVIYDEGHNLSDQQTDLLLDLEPDVIISATATPRYSQKLLRILDRLKTAGWEDERLTVQIPEKAVVDAGLIKTHLVIAGYDTNMESAVDELLRDMKAATTAAIKLGVALRPKAIYVCATNTVTGAGGRPTKENHLQPFTKRLAPPILIWRYLTEKKGVDPKNIAAYCDLQVHKDYPLPKSFVLYRGGDKDYTAFRSGDYSHIIFNLGLQEGWDDPECYFAYVDKSMGSPLQVEQLIGRVLRQPGGKHQEDIRLNTASFYVRLDDRTVFPKILQEVRNAIELNAPGVEIHAYPSRQSKNNSLYEPRSRRVVPRISVNASDARAEIAKVMKRLIDYRSDTINTVGKGARAKIRRRIAGPQTEKFEWVDGGTANRIIARAIFLRKIASIYPRAANVCDIEDPKLDAYLEVGSPAAAEVESRAEEVANSFLRFSELCQKASDAVVIGPIYADPKSAVVYRHSIHRGYSGLNRMEQDIAAALDKTRLPWTRNVPRSGYGIPLLTRGRTATFYPDFLVWKKQTVFALEPKGQHLLNEDAGRKLLAISQIGRGARVIVRIIAQGTWKDATEQTDVEGFTVFRLKDGKPFALPCKDIECAVLRALTL